MARYTDSLLYHLLFVDKETNKWTKTMFLQYKSFENSVGKGENAGTEQFLHFPVFSTLSESFQSFSSIIKLLSANSLSLERSKICCFVNREYVYSAVVYQKYLTRLRELIIFEPWRENYHFSQPS